MSSNSHNSIGLLFINKYETNATKDFSYKDIETLKNKINSLSESHHNFILKIICDYKIEFSENKNGCFINLLNVPNEALYKIEQYVNFIVDKEVNLKEFETYKESMLNSNNT